LVADTVIQPRRKSMNSGRYPFTLASARTMAAAVLVASIAIAPSLAFAARATSEDRAEVRIKDMHAKLQISAAQEDQWAKITQAMREDAATMDALTQARFANAKTTNAVDDLKSYGGIAEAHANGIKKFTALFEPLYASMSDAQKAQADTLFRTGERRSGHKKTAASK
jgi:hypothetical protein